MNSISCEPDHLKSVFGCVLSSHFPISHGGRDRSKSPLVRADPS